MPYTRQTWIDNNLAFPVSAERMIHIEDGLVDHEDRIADVEAGAGGLGSNVKGVVIHNGTSWPARPSGYASIEWIGPTDPAGSVTVLDNDTWVDTTP